MKRSGKYLLMGLVLAMSPILVACQDLFGPKEQWCVCVERDDYYGFCIKRKCEDK